jgi:carbonic anhydrase/acetyltransferase-like protein (isoleucine patch superfamily)
LAGSNIPPLTVAAGSPAIVKKPLEGKARWWIERSGLYYVDLARRYKEQGLEGV